MRTLEGSNRIRNGVMGIIMLVIVIGVGQSIASVPMLFATPTYYAQFADTGGINKGDKVRIAGVDVGKVRSMEIDGDKVKIGYSLDGTQIGTESRASIRTDTILGKRDIEIEPRGTKPLRASGVLPHHAFDTLVRLTAGFALAACVGIAAGVLMGRSCRAEDILLPLVSIGAPIPGLAYAPLFLLWFGPGNIPAIALVAFVSTFPVIYNSWTGVKAVKEIWLRSAQAMGADDRRLFRHVVLPGALPYIVTGLRLGLAQAWRILVAVEMLAAVPWGLGWLIFGAQEFLNTDVMLAGIAVIALIGLGLEKLVFQPLENFTVVRWGMMT